MEKMPDQTYRARIRPGIALRGIARQIRDSEDTQAGALFVYALDGPASERVYQRFRSDPLGARILDERRSIRAALTDRERLRSLPEGTLGRVYVDFMDAEGISLEGLIEETEDPIREVFGDEDPDRRFVRNRIIDLHDLWHVATGYSRDMVGEFALVAFGYEQLGTLAYGLALLFIRPLCAWQAPGANALITHARQRARRSDWLPVQAWEDLLDLPIDEARTRLGLGAPPAYTRHYRVGGRLRPEGWQPVARPA